MSPATSSTQSDQLIQLSDERVATVPIRDNGEGMASLQYASFLSVDGRKRNASPSFHLVRLGVIDRLSAVAKALPEGMRLLLIEGYRTPELQKEYFEEYQAELRQLHPEWTDEVLHSETSKYVAPPDAAPPHTTGGAVDLTLVTSDGKELDLGSRVNADPVESKGACFTDAVSISPSARANRSLLIRAMEDAGFVNYPTEWWHWSYGDRYWALLTKQSHAIYGQVR